MNSPMQAMIDMRMNQPQPTGVGQQLATSAPSAPPGAPQGPEQDQGGPMPPGAAQGLSAFGDASVGGGNMQALMQYLPMLLKMYPKLYPADVKKGRAELTGPTQEQFLGAVHAKHHGAKEHHVRNRGRGQRLHVSF
jgi:hypothetical protein